MKRLSDQTLYEIIEVSVETSPEEIARACDRAAATYGAGSLVTYTLASSEESALLSSRIEEARAVLLDPSARSRYDERIGVRPHATPLPASPGTPVQALPPPPETRPEPGASSPAWPPAEVDVAVAEPLHISPGLPVFVPVAPPATEPAAPSATVPAAQVVSSPPPATLAPEGSRVHGGTSPAESSPWLEPASPGGDEVQHPAAPPQAAAPLAPDQPSAVAAPLPLALARPEPQPAPPIAPVAPIALTRAVAPILLDREVPPPRPLLVPEGAAWSGEMLRRVRESRGLTLQQVAERTRITRHHLENIELDRFKALPAAVYLRGIIMSLARELRLDGQKVARSYLDRMGPASDGEAKR